MKTMLYQQMFLAGALMLTTPVVLLAQDTKTKEKDKKERQQIIITRTGDDQEKTVIEIDGSKIRINGKDAANLDDVKVKINSLKGSGAWAIGPNGNNFDFNFDIDHPSVFRVDSNRAMLGVNTTNNDKGAEVELVNESSAAAKAGLKKGDVITRINDKKVEDADDLTTAVKAHKPGDKVTITYLRDGKEQKATTELGRWKGVNVRAMTAPRVLMNADGRNKELFERTMPRMEGMMEPSRMIMQRGPKLGLAVQDTEDGKGLKVVDVDDESHAAKAGVKEGDIITSVDGNAVNNADEISKLMREKKDQASIKMNVLRNGKAQTIDVKIPKKLKTVDL